MFRTMLGGMGLLLAGAGYFSAAEREPSAVSLPPPVLTVSQQSATTAVTSPHRAVLNRYCVTCHNQKLKTAGIMLDTMNVEHVGESAPEWEKVVRKLRTDAMPPAGMPRPDKAVSDSLVTYLETELDRAAGANPNPGRPALHRLNRTEYANAIRDILAVDTKAIDVPSLLPADDSGYGFDNIGDVLTVSSTLMEAYISASRKISRLAVGDPAAQPVIQTYEIPRYVMQDRRMSEDLPFHSRGGTAIRHYFPVDAEYVIRIRLQRNTSVAGNSVVFGFAEPHLLDVRVDGARVKLFTVGGGQQPDEDSGTQAQWDEVDAALEVRLPVKAGTHLVGVAFQNQLSEPEGVFQPALTDYTNASADTAPALGSIVIGGPYDAEGVGDTPSRRRIFVCQPTSSNNQDACATKILSALARRAYRRPVTEQDLKPLLRLYSDGRGLNGSQDQAGVSFERGIQTALQRILVDPEFLFRIERDPANVPPGTPFRVSDLELASRLSFFLWSSVPDDELLELAERGRLKDLAVLEQQTKRMLADPRSRALVDNFAGQWLYLRNVRATWPNPDVFPDFVANLRDDFEQETKLFFESMLRENRSVADLLRADYTFLNDRLAQHYGIRSVNGGHFRRVTLTDENRKGLLGQGSVLMVTSYATRTAPTIRGKWLLENILGAPPPPPPPDVPSLDEARTAADGKPLTVREQLEAHRVNPACATCHRVMDPLGFALENFDATGKWRTTDSSGGAIDASGVLPDGTKFKGPAELRTLLLRRPDLLVHTVAEKLLTYAMGRGVEYYDAPALRKIVGESAPGGYRWSTVIENIIKSMPFQMRRSS